MHEWEKNLQGDSLSRRVDQIEEDTSRSMNFLSLKVLHASPGKTFGGMVVFADGVNWNPGSGQGVYVRDKDNAAWRHLG